MKSPGHEQGKTTLTCSLTKANGEDGIGNIRIESEIAERREAGNLFGNEEATRAAAPISRPRIAVQVLGAMMLCWISYGTDNASGIVYDRLLLPECKGQPAWSTSITENSSVASGQTKRMSKLSINGTSFTVAPTLHSVVTAGRIGTTGENRTDSDCGGFGKGAAQTAWAVSLPSACRFFSSWMASIFIDAFGVQPTVATASVVYAAGMAINSFTTDLYQLYLSQSLLVGLGSGFLYVAPVHCFSLSLHERMSVGAGLGFLGSGIGDVVYGYAGKEVIEAGDWPWFFRMVAILALFGIPSAFAVYIRPPVIAGKQLSKQSLSMDKVRGCCGPVEKLRVGFRALLTSLRKGKVLYRDLNFILALCAHFFYALGYFIPIVAASHRSRVLGIGTSPSVQVAYIGFGVMAGGGLTTVSGSLSRARGTLLQAITLLLMGGSTLLSVMITSRTPLIAYNIVYACLQSACAALCGPAAREFAPGEMTVLAAGHLFLMSTVPSAIGVPISGWIYDATQSYVMPMVAGGLILVLAGIFMLIADFRIWRQRRPLSCGQGKLPVYAQDKSTAMVSGEGSRKLLVSSTSSDVSIRATPVVIYVSSL